MSDGARLLEARAMRQQEAWRGGGQTNYQANSRGRGQDRRGKEGDPEERGGFAPHHGALEPMVEVLTAREMPNATWEHRSKNKRGRTGKEGNSKQ